MRTYLGRLPAHEVAHLLALSGAAARRGIAVQRRQQDMSALRCDAGVVASAARATKRGVLPASPVACR